MPVTIIKVKVSINNYHWPISSKIWKIKVKTNQNIVDDKIETQIYDNCVWRKNLSFL